MVRVQRTILNTKRKTVARIYNVRERRFDIGKEKRTRTVLSVTKYDIDN